MRCCYGSCLPADVVVTTGSQDGFDRVFDVLLNEGDGIFVERPTYSGVVNPLMVSQRLAGLRFLLVLSDSCCALACRCAAVPSLCCLVCCTGAQCAHCQHPHRRARFVTADAGPRRCSKHSQSSPGTLRDFRSRQAWWRRLWNTSCGTGRGCTRGTSCPAWST